MNTRTLGPVVSSAHLADGSFPEISELEFGLIIAANAFNRWVVRAMTAAGQPELSALEVLVLHTVRHRDRPKTLAGICLVLNVEDTHTVNYAVKKLVQAGLVETGRQAKEKTVMATEAGRQACTRYREIRERLLLEAVLDHGLDPKAVSHVAAVLRMMSGQYDQAARAATVL
ncbi:MAG: winged helix DNA-binding protein [Silicimonas sp.]|jgi:predicted MarR family transcription regulator|nr:winged helix DNA-binding protein [Silicimonas sp.]